MWSLGTCAVVKLLSVVNSHTHPPTHTDRRASAFFPVVYRRGALCLVIHGCSRTGSVGRGDGFQSPVHWFVPLHTRYTHTQAHCPHSLLCSRSNLDLLRSHMAWFTVCCGTRENGEISGMELRTVQTEGWKDKEARKSFADEREKWDWMLKIYLAPAAKIQYLFWLNIS